MLSANIRDRPLNNSLNPRCLSMPYGSMVLRRFYKDDKRMFWFEYGQIIFYILRFFFNIYLEKFWVVFYLFSLANIDFVFYIPLIIKHV